MDLCNLSVIKELMNDAGITFRKDYGQNFLTNRLIPEAIADSCTDLADSLIIEIGPGIGCLTSELAQRYKRVVAIEIDKGLIPILGKTLAEYDNVTVINQDVMKTDIKSPPGRRRNSPWKPSGSFPRCILPTSPAANPLSGRT